MADMRDLPEATVANPALHATRNAPWWSELFRALRNRNFLLLWIGQALQSEGQWMEQVARGWLLWELSGDPFMLGLYATLRNVPQLLLSIPAGILTDRVSRIRLIQLSQLAAFAFSVIFAVLVHTQIITVWIVLSFALLNGIFETIRMPARQAMVATVVPGSELLNAVAINEVAQYTMRILGPILAGGLITAFDDPFQGVAAVFYLRGGLYLVTVFATMFIEAPAMSHTARDRSVWQNIGDGFRYLGVNRTLLAVAMLGAVPAAFGQPYQHLMPIFADLFEVGPFGLGLMSGAVGVGALVGSLILASLGSVQRMGWLLFGSLVAYGVAIVTFGLTPWFELALALLLLVGASQALFQAMRQTMTQLLVRDDLRGRVTSVTQLTRGGLSPVGSLQAGVLAGIIGAPGAVIIMGTILGGIGLACALALPGLRRLQYSDTTAYADKDLAH